MVKLRFFSLFVLAAAFSLSSVQGQKRPPAPAPSVGPSWLQWGGPNRDFKVQSSGLKEAWPANGPARLWERTLGEGHSTVLAEDGKLYTMYSAGQREIIISLDAATGRTVWEFGYEAKSAGLDLSEGKGPHATTLIVGRVIYAVGVKGTMHALDKTTGKLIWKQDLWGEYKGYFEDRGYSPSPVAYKNMIIVPVGGGDGKQCLMAFDQQSGAQLWRNVSFVPAPASPIVINVGGQDQIVHCGGNEVYGADPTNGNLLWSYPHKTSYGLNIATPVWEPSDGTLFISSAYGTGSRMLQLVRNGNTTNVTQLWENKKMRIHFGTMIRIDDVIYGSSGDFGPAFFTAIQAKTGQIAYQDRGLARSSFVYADGKFIVIDEDGTLAIARSSVNSLKILSKAPVLSNRAWTAPTLIGTKLFLRDRRTLMALELN